MSLRITLASPLLGFLSLLALLNLSLVHSKPPAPAPFPVPPFSCPYVPASEFVPTSVLKLRPADIQGVMAMGDSITAGFAMAGNFPHNIFEFRGLVFSIGGDEFTDGTGDTKTLSVPRFLHQYNNNITGFSTGLSLLKTKGASLNAAVSGAKSTELAEQVQYLKSQVATTYHGLASKWKLLTLFIGANDICSVCREGRSVEQTADSFETQLRSTLSDVHKAFPMTFVNVMNIFDITGVWKAASPSEFCRSRWSDLGDLGINECSCMKKNNSTRDMIAEVTPLVNNAVNKVAEEFSSEVTGDDKFHVVAQPAIQDIQVDKFGLSFLSTFDCFHPSLPADEIFSYLLWNNMFTPAEHKQTSVSNPMKFICPNETHYLQ
eukprot:TRINITY_DN3890_c0_g1_i1.p1 TRINITY_DN3890_c0_g1~~TRINITY_DN3890_c0_g1_i1.p1  ORF type:complete len:376 (+),score=73.28 TRINITY_DN3890_c0_g1_i1:56-1183(+)